MGLYARSPLEKPVTIIIPKGAGVQDIADLLISAGVIDNVRLFVLGAQYAHAARRMRSGEFASAGDEYAGRCRSPG